jgi:7,8-dihydropterin-6-yl-methyl-4-(beta-D-ribofuranosyl)aminobenzene 5'-phosphate synthase
LAWCLLGDWEALWALTLSIKEEKPAVLIVLIARSAKQVFLPMSAGSLFLREVKMNIQVLFDKETQRKDLHIGWGVSFLVDDKILFDTGEKGEWLISNMRALKVDINKIQAVVISHDHWDHRDGLWKLLEKNHHMKVYVGSNFSQKFKDRVRSYQGQLVEVDVFTAIDKDIYTTGKIDGKYLFQPMPEQALIVKTPKGLVILTGCAHPGIIKMLEAAQQRIHEKIYLVIGGFHLMGKRRKTIQGIINKFRELGVEKAAATHCTGKTAIKLFKEEYKDNFVEVRVGEVIHA